MRCTCGRDGLLDTGTPSLVTLPRAVQVRLPVFSQVSANQTLTPIFTNLQEADGLVLINIDNGSITCSNEEDVDLPDIPLLAAQTFIQR